MSQVRRPERKTGRSVHERPVMSDVLPRVAAGTIGQRVGAGTVGPTAAQASIASPTNGIAIT